MSTPEERLQRYMDNVKRANKKYLEKNRELINEKMREYYHSKLATNEEFKAKKRAYAKEYYYAKKALQQTHKDEE